MRRKTTLIAISLGLMLFGFVSLSLASDNVVIVLDNSGSMQGPMRSGGSKMQAAKTALNTVLTKLPNDANVGLLVFQNKQQRTSWVFEPGPVDLEASKKSIAKIVPSGGTPLGKYMKIAVDRLLEVRERERFGSFRLLIVSDGEANDGKLVQKYLPDILARGIVVDVIGVAMKSSHSLATQVHSYRRADDRKSLEKAIQQVLAESVRNEKGEQDYSLLSGISNDLGRKVLDALSESGTRNEPIR